MTAADPAPLTPLPPLTGVASKMDLRDFPDRLSPMVVKELRQGLRSPLFVWAFIIVHLILVMVVLAGLDEGSKQEMTMFFWWSFIIPVVLLMPARGINALTDEVRMKTMETLLLTRLSAWRICVGKWIAIIAQIWLIGVTVLPYLIMRYFSGGLDLWNEVKWLFHFLVIASCFTAATVGFSWQKHFLFRGIITLGIGFAIGGLCAFITEELIARDRYTATSFRLHEGSITLFFYVMTGYLAYYFLDYAAAQIAPLAENRSTTRRVVTLVLAVLLAALCYWKEDFAPVCLMAQIVLLSLAGGDAATERTKQVSIIVQPFVKRGFLGKLAGRFLYPGWHSGYLFYHLLVACTVATAVGMMLHFGRRYSVEREFVLFCLVAYGQVALCLTIQRRFFPRVKSPLAVFIIIGGAIGLLHLLVLLLSEVGNIKGIHAVMLWSPIDAYFFRSYSYYGSQVSSEWMTWSAILAGIYSLMMSLMVGREFRVTRQVEAQAQADLEEEASYQRPPAA